MDNEQKNIIDNDKLAEIEQEIKDRKQELAKIENEKAKKPITEVDVSDIKVKFNDDLPVAQQAEDVVDAMATADVVKDPTIRTSLTNKKADELVNKAEAKATKAKQGAIEAETELQKAERDLYEAVLNTFGIYKHLPRGLMKVLVYIFSPLYTIISLLIGIPCGFCKILVDNLDGIICRYNDTKDGVKPKIKVIFIILLALVVLAAICLTVLACCHII